LSRDMMLTVDEYMALRRLISSERESEGTTLSLVHFPDLSLQIDTTVIIY